MPVAGIVKVMGGLCALDGRISDVELMVGLGVAYVMSIPNTKKRESSICLNRISFVTYLGRCHSVSEYSYLPREHYLDKQTTRC